MQDDLGDRMKDYEGCYQTKVARKSYVMFRIDGRAFHTFTKKMKKPVYENLSVCMVQSALATCQEMAGAKLAYTQSDECSILIHDKEKLETQPWFGNEVQKLVSVSASLFTAHFNQLYHRIDRKAELATFDSRVFALSQEEVCNYFIWRQNDCSRNYISCLARTLYSHKELQGKTCQEMEEMMLNDNDLKLEDKPVHHRRGIALYREQKMTPLPDTVPEHIRKEKGEVERWVWKIDRELPIITKNRNFVEQWI